MWNPAWFKFAAWFSATREKTKHDESNTHDDETHAVKESYDTMEAKKKPALNAAQIRAVRIDRHVRPGELTITRDHGMIDCMRI